MGLSLLSPRNYFPISSPVFGEGGEGVLISGEAGRGPNPV
jgi:hypothetical protein